LRQASFKHWLLLGEAQSKCEHIAGSILDPRVAQLLYQVFLAKGVLATTAIEGNTLTEEEVLQRLEGKLTLPSSKEYLGQEVDNIVEACNQIGQHILSGQSVELHVEDIKHYNRIVLKNLPLNQGVVPGEIRKHEVGVGRYKGAPPEDCEYLLESLCSWLNQGFEAPEGYKIAFGILKAILAHLYIAWIHPFGDGNGRAARLIEFQILLSVGVPATAAHLLSNHYNQTRAEYYRQLDMTHKSGGDVFHFIEYALRGFVDGLKEQIEIIKGQQVGVHWIKYINDKFSDKDSKADTRRKWLVFDLSHQQDPEWEVGVGPVPISKIRYITPRIAEAYANKTDKTIKRDINALVEMGLVERTPKGVRAKPEIMRAFLPPTRIQK
jgi:Fic family protein